MTKTYIKNKGTTTFISSIPGHDDNYKKVDWDVDYDGNRTNIEMDVNLNGKSKHVDYELTNSDLADILNIPSFKMPLEERLINDFPMREEDFFQSPSRRKEMIIIPAFRRKSFRVPHLIQPLRIRRMKSRSHKTNFRNRTFSSLRKKLLTPKPRTLRLILKPRSSSKKMYMVR